MRPNPDASDAVLALRPFSCRWPIGHPSQPGFHFCAERALIGEVYCDEHCWRAYPATGRRQPGKSPADARAA
jgi:GcrA cell cycle regulator